MKEKRNKIVFTVDGVEYAVRKANVKEGQEAQNAYNRAFSEAIKSGAIPAAKVDDYVREYGLWNDEKEAKEKELDKLVREERKKLAKVTSVGEGKKIALAVKKLLRDLSVLRSGRNSLDGATIQNQAWVAQVNKLVSLCTVYNETGDRYYNSYEDYLEQQDEKITQEAVLNMNYLLLGVDPQAEKKLPENKFLLENKLVDEKLRWINEDGHLTDEDGRLIDEDGRYVSPNGEFVDRDGNRVDEDGNYLD